MTLAVGCLVANEALMKLASEVMPASQMVFLRSVCATVLLAAVAWKMDTPLRPQNLANGRVIARSVLDALATATFMAAILHVHLANAIAINMTTPVIFTVLAWLVFRETVGVWRWTAVLGGFAGVLLVVQPAAGNFNAWSLLILACAVLLALRDLATRWLPAEITSLQVTLVTSIVAVVLSAAWALTQAWTPVGAREFGLIVSAAALVCGGQFLTVVAFRGSDASIIAPLRYLGLVFSAILGYLIWGHTPDVAALLGMALIVLAGLALLRKG